MKKKWISISKRKSPASCVWTEAIGAFRIGTSSSKMSMLNQAEIETSRNSLDFDTQHAARKSLVFLLFFRSVDAVYRDDRHGDAKKLVAYRILCGNNHHATRLPNKATMPAFSFSLFVFFFAVTAVADCSWPSSQMRETLEKTCLQRGAACGTPALRPEIYKIKKNYTHGPQDE